MFWKISQRTLPVLVQLKWQVLWWMITFYVIMSSLINKPCTVHVRIDKSILQEILWSPPPRDTVPQNGKLHVYKPLLIGALFWIILQPLFISLMGDRISNWHISLWNRDANPVVDGSSPTLANLVFYSTPNSLTINKTELSLLLPRHEAPPPVRSSSVRASRERRWHGTNCESEPHASAPPGQSTERWWPRPGLGVGRLHA